MKNLSLLIIGLLLSALTLSQSTKVWLTIEDHQQIRILQSNFNLINLGKALPDSKSNDLQKVYEIEIAGDYSAFMEYVNKTVSLVNPELIEDFTPLYEPNDYNSEFAEDYALDIINAKKAWNITKGSSTIKIGISDSNFDTLHEELVGTFSFMAPDIYGTNYHHGTAVAVTAAGNTNNNLGKSSIGNKCDMMLYGMSYNHILQATYAGARVVNLSWASGCSFNSYYQSVIDEVYNNGTVIIAAAGNGPTCGGSANYVYPASFDKVISVSSVGPNDNHQRFPGDASSTHQHNDSVDLVAPGYDVALAIANNAYTTGNGTSFASPFVAGTVGLMLSVNPCLSPADVEMILKATAVSVDAQNPLYMGELGEGRLDAHAAVQMAKDLIPIDFTVLLNEATCSNGIPNITVQLNEGNVNDYNLQWSDGSDDWNRNNLNPGNYNFTISSPSGCSINQEFNFQPTGPYFDYPNSIFINEENFVLVDSNNDGVINVRGSMVIGNGINYSIDGKNINFTDNPDLSGNYPNSGLVVKDGAHLIVEGANLNSVNECSNKWGGIELWSSESNTSAVSINNTTIENARVGVSNISKYAYNNDIEEIGGKINILNTTINNSKMAVNIIETIGDSKLHDIVNNTFSNSANILNPIFINIDGADYVSIMKNTFNGSDAVETTLRGTAIYANNSTINAMHTKPSIQDLSYDNTYNNLYKGICFSNTSKKILDVTIYNELFNNVEKCLVINGQFKGEVAFNEFNITSGSSEDKAFGVKTVGQNNILISENLFLSLASIDNYGMIVESNETGEGVIKTNSFEGNFTNGINFIGANSFEEVSCNDFNITGQYDWFIYKNDSGQLGSLNVEKELNINQFSDSNNVVLNLKNHHDNQIFHYRDAYEFMPYEVCESITVEEMQLEVNRENYCFNEGNGNTRVDLSLSTDEEAVKEETVSIYPNPSNGVINIASDNDSKIDQVNIMTMEGKVIESINWNQQQSIDLTNYSAGTYLVGLQLGGSSVKTERVVIL